MSCSTYGQVLVSVNLFGKQSKTSGMGQRTPVLQRTLASAFSKRCVWGAHPSSEPLALEDPSCNPRPHLEPSSRPIAPDIGAECVHGPSNPDST